MNELLNFAGALIYLAFTIILFPVFMLFDVLMGCWLALRFVARLRHRLQHKAVRHHQHWQVKKSLQSLRRLLPEHH